ncbi:hypothetical protein ACEPAG_2753 [Sanghuangporus baumii]
MGTSSVTIYRHNGIYYKLNYHSHDGYPEYDGAEIVSEIPTDKPGFEEWLKTKRQHFDAEKVRIAELESNFQDLGYEIDFDDMGDIVYISNRLHDSYTAKPISEYSYSRSHDYVYVIDLDRLIFSVNDGAFFPLDNIPRGDGGNKWMAYLALDGDEHVILLPDAPRHFTAGLYHHPTLFEDGLKVYSDISQDIKIIDESSWDHRDGDQACRAIASTYTKSLMMWHYFSFMSQCRMRSDLHARVAISELLLRAASPCGFALTISTQAVQSDRIWIRDYLQLPDRIQYPAFYRYRGCLIMPTGDFSAEKHLEANIGKSIERAKEKGTDRCTVIIISILHVAVAIIEGAASGNLKVSHSRPQPFFYGFGHEGPDKGLDLIAHYLRPHCVDGPTANVEISGRRDFNYCALPWEILVDIMHLVDIRTYESFGRTCKSLRREWFIHPRIHDYTVCGVIAPSSKPEKTSYLPNCFLRARDQEGELTTLRLSYMFDQDRFNQDNRYETCPNYDPEPNENDVYSKRCCHCPDWCYQKWCRWRPDVILQKGHEHPGGLRGKDQLDYSFYTDTIFFEDKSGLFFSSEDKACPSCARCIAN